MSSEHAEAIARRIEELRVKKDIERRGLGTRLSEITGVTRKAANKWLNGENAPKADHIKKIAQFFDVNTSWLEYGESTMDRPAQRIHHSLTDTEAYEVNEAGATYDLFVPYFEEVQLAAGAGLASILDSATEKVAIPITILQEAGIPGPAVASCRICGDSMANKIMDGAKVFIDTREKQINDGKIYAIDHGGMLRIKYLFRQPFGGIRIRSENSEDFPDELLSSEEAGNIRIIGRVFWQLPPTF